MTKKITTPTPQATYAYKPLDGLAKSILRILLDGYGQVLSPEVYLVDPPRYAHHLYTALTADTLFHRTRDHAADVLFSGVYDLCGPSSMWEPYSDTPDLKDLKACVEKALTYKRTWRAPDPPIFHDNDLSHFELLIPVPSVNTSLSQVLTELGFTAAHPWLWSLPKAWGVNVVDLKELAATNDSHKYLPLLLMGSGKTRSDAIAGLVALKHNSKALALLLSLQSWYGVAAATPDPDPQTKEFINDMETIFDLKEKNGILTGQISTITGALEHLKLTDVERQIIANKIVT
jgi:hypothetical protein